MATSSNEDALTLIEKIFVGILTCALLPFAAIYILLKEKKEHIALQKRMKEEHPDLQFFMEHIETFMRLYEDVRKNKEIYEFRFSDYCGVFPMQISGGGEYQTLGCLLREYKNPKSGWFKDDFYVKSCFIRVLSGGIYITGWDNQKKEWIHTQSNVRLQVSPDDRKIFEKSGRVDNAELSGLFNKLKELKKSVDKTG